MSAYSDAVNASSPAAWWRFEETSGSTAADEISTNDLTLTGANLNVTGTSETGSAIDFDGTDDFAESDAALGWTGAHSLTVETWLNLDASAAATATPAAVFLLWRDTNGDLAFQVRDSANTTWAVASTSMPAHDAWHHVVGVWDRPAKRARLYLNGILVASSAEQSFEDIGALSEKVLIAKGETGSAFADGSFDEVAIYQAALTPAAVQDHYLAGGGATLTYAQTVTADAPAAWWRFTETTGTTAEDEIGSLDLTVTGANLNVSGTANTGSAIDFDGTDDEAATATGLDWDGAHDLTVEAWLNLDALPAAATDTPAATMLLWRDTSGNLAFQVRNAANNAWAVASTTMPSTGSWHHVVGVWDRTAKRARLYLDGSLANSSSEQSWSDLGPLSEVVNVAGSATGSAFTSGLMDEIAFYQTALPLSRVIAHYDAGRTSVHALAADASGAGDITGALGVTRYLTAATTATGDLTGAQTAVLRVAAAAAGAGDASGALTRTVPLAATHAGSGDVTTAILSALRLASSITATGDATGALGVTRYLTAAVTASGDASLAQTAVLRVAAAAAGQSATTTALEAVRPVTASVAGSGDVTADVAGASGLDASITGAGDITSAILAALRLTASTTGAGDITTSTYAAITLASALAGSGDITGALDRIARLTASDANAGDITSALSVIIPIATAISGTGDVTIGILAARYLHTAITGAGDIAGTLTNVLPLVADATGTGDITSGITAAIALSAAATGAGDITSGIQHITPLTLTPASSSSVVNIVNELGQSANPHASVDEGMGSPDGDATYLVNTLPQDGSVRLGITGVPADFDGMRNLSVRVRARREA